MRSLLQFTLDLFDSPGPPQPLAPTETVPHGPVAQNLPALPERPAPPPVAGRPKPQGPSRPALPLADTLAPARFAHPRASRTVVLGHAQVSYEFTRGKRKTIGFLVGAEGLSVRAPRWVALRDVDAALQEKAGWIVRKLDEAQQRQARHASARIEWQDGARFPFLGEEVTLRLDPRHAFTGVGAMLDADGGALRELHLSLPQSASPAQIRDAAQAWLMREARRVFEERLAVYAPRLGVRWTKLSLSNAATRWGSASADGAIRLNWRLIHYRLPLIDYVVAHELAHLRVMDHSPRFWETVESVVPDYGTLRQQLRDEPAPR